MQTGFMSHSQAAAAWRDHMIALAPLAAKTVSDILNDPKSSPSVRLRAALAILRMASTPEPAQPRLKPARSHIAPPPTNEIAAHSGITTVRKAPEPGRNSQCPCGSGMKFKRCCAFSQPYLVTSLAKESAQSPEPASLTGAPSHTPEYLDGTQNPG